MSDASHPRLVLLPGMGVDERFFGPQRLAFPALEVPPWIEPRGHETLSAYAQRLAGTIDPSPPLYVGGVSFGGMVALEAARWLNAQAVFLIASCRSPRSVARHARVLERLGRSLPDWAVRPLVGPVTTLIAWRNGLRPQQAALFRAAVADTPLSFLRWASRALLEWPGVEDDAELPCPVYHIHGGIDPMIPAARVRADRVVPAGGHLINLTHAEEVNAFIRARLSAYSP